MEYDLEHNVYYSTITVHGKKVDCWDVQLLNYFDSPEYTHRVFMLALGLPVDPLEIMIRDFLNRPPKFEPMAFYPAVMDSRTTSIFEFTKEIEEMMKHFKNVPILEELEIITGRNRKTNFPPLRPGFIGLEMGEEEILRRFTLMHGSTGIEIINPPPPFIYDRSRIPDTFFMDEAPKFDYSQTVLPLKIGIDRSISGRHGFKNHFFIKRMFKNYKK